LIEAGSILDWDFAVQNATAKAKKNRSVFFIAEFINYYLIRLAT